MRVTTLLKECGLVSVTVDPGVVVGAVMIANVLDEIFGVWMVKHEHMVEMKLLDSVIKD